MRTQTSLVHSETSTLRQERGIAYAGNSLDDPEREDRRGRKNQPLALVVDDDPYSTKILCFVLEYHRFKCAGAATGEATLKMLEKRRPDLILLDLLMPKMDGFELIGRIRQVSSVPILAITALPEAHHRVRALELGADDCLTKPLDYDVVVAKAKALIRRVALTLAGHGEGILELGDLRVDLRRRRVSRGSVDLELETTHWRLLYNLLERRGRVVPYDELQESVWPGARHERAYLQQWISRLRRRIGDTDAHIIRSFPGQGYSIEVNGQ